MMLLEFPTPEPNESERSALREFAADAVNSRNLNDEYRRHLTLPNAIVHPDGVIEIREDRGQSEGQ